MTNERLAFEEWFAKNFHQGAPQGNVWLAWQAALAWKQGTLEPAAPPAIEPRVFRGNGPDCLGCGKTLSEHLTNYNFCPGLPENRSVPNEEKK